MNQTGKPTALIFGCGYLGRRVAQRWLDAGRTVFAVTRSEQNADRLRDAGLRPIVADVTRPETLVDLPAVETVFYAVGYDAQATASRQSLHVNGLRAVLAALPCPARFVYISSTGVYGTAGGGWIDETTPCRPTRESGLAILAAEEALAAHPIGGRAIVLRLAGLYGPGRISRLADVKAGRPIAVPAEGNLNLIHVDDAVAVILAAEAHATAPRTYLVSDGRPTPRREFYRRLAELLAAPSPQFLPLSADSRELRSATDKRVDNSRMLRELGVGLRYPSYHEGLAAIVAGV
jgi:nucleoside-diphosphate-sugar epimerase